MLVLTQRLSFYSERASSATLKLPLTAEERVRSRYRCYAEQGEEVALHLPRGTVLRDRDILQPDSGSPLVMVVAKPEPVLEVSAKTPLALLRAAYHLGNRHVPLEIAASYLRLAPDPVLKSMLENLGVEVREKVYPFQPEPGAYGHSHAD